MNNPTRKRPSQPSDHDELEKCMHILFECMRSHPEIEPTIWSGACVSCLVNGMKLSGLSYEEFKEILQDIIDHFKVVWDDWEITK